MAFVIISHDGTVSSELFDDPMIAYKAFVTWLCTHPSNDNLDFYLHRVDQATHQLDPTWNRRVYAEGIFRKP